MRKSVSVAFFSLMSTLLIFGTVIMGGSELVLFSNYFAQERYDVLDEVVNVAQRTASHLVQEAALPEGEELEALNTKLELIGESAEVYLFFTDCDGNVVLASDPDDLAGDVVEASVLEKSAKAKENYHIFGTLDGVLTEKSYISVHEMRSESGECTGYLFLCSSGDRLVEFRKEFFSNFFLSACLMLLVASVLTKVMMHKLTDPIQKVTDAAQRFGGGDLSVRVEGVDGEGEVADLARTFNKMADNIQSNDNSRGQFMGNIAHELRTPIAVIQGYANLLNRWGKDDPATRQEAIDAIRQEADSMKELEVLGVTKPKIALSADTTVSLPPAPEDVVDGILDSVGIPVHGNYIGFVLRPWPSFEEKAKVIAAAADYAYETYGYTPVFFPIEPRLDVSAAQRVIQRMHAPHYLFTEAYTAAQTIGILSRMKVVVSMRLHGLIFAGSQGVPLVGIVYDQKVSSFLSYIGQDLYEDLNKLSEEKLKVLIDGAISRGKNPRLLSESVEKLRRMDQINREFLEQYAAPQV